MQPNTTTITALATPPGRGGIAIIRVSGAKVAFIIEKIVNRKLIPRLATHCHFLDAKAHTIDEGIAIYFPAPNSFTGEDVLELQGHGSPVVVDLILQRLLELGATLAKPGEFSERAFLNDRLDLAQAEAIADLIDASSQQAARSAMRSLQGAFSQEINALSEKIIHLRMYIEAAIDFSDEEIDFLADERVIKQAQTIQQDLISIQQRAKQGSLLREGITAVIIGEPNVGKSSLLNALSGKELAIVTDIPGTTRDVLRDQILIEGMPLHIIDTAGLRESEDIVEQEGIKRAYAELAKADMVLFVSDFSSAPQQKAIDNVITKNLSLKPDIPVISILNKIDVSQTSPAVNVKDGKIMISLSAKTGAGLDLLRAQIKSLMGFEGESDGVYLARRRHLDALYRAYQHVEMALSQLANTQAGELAAEDLRLAHLALCEITGEFTADDLLGKIFSSFCIGK